MRSLEILGCRLDTIGAEEATKRILAFAADRTGAHVVTLGTEMVVYAQRDGQFRDTINRCALSLCDTVGLLAVARRRGAALRERVTGVELIELLCEKAAAADMPVFLFGGAPGVAAEAAAILQGRFAGLKVAGTRSGYIASAEANEIAWEIRNSGARLLFVGLGSPRQEFWLAENLPRSGAGAGIGVGGSFDVISGRVRRAPHLWRKLNLEWLYRLASEPARWRRQLALPYFVWLIALDRFGLYAKKGTTPP
ncbi:MAG: WecB/TagA/CpsF family glycosyltransferase [Candidatus Eremiobacteraeota bacterium]|nr:WecB/TagA/CpsF family glycosyltransferase [Candidatus Eremiobacteraeota bacterium]